MVKANIRGLDLTAKQFGLYDDAAETIGKAGLEMAVKALNQALREAATLVQDEIRVEGPLRGRKLDDAIERALMDKWEDVAATYAKAGAADTECTEMAAEALRKLFCGMKGEERTMRTTLRTLEEAGSAGVPMTAQERAAQRALR